MKNQALFSWKDKSEKSKCRLLQFLFGTLRVNGPLDSISVCIELSPRVREKEEMICKRQNFITTPHALLQAQWALALLSSKLVECPSTERYPASSTGPKHPLLSFNPFLLLLHCCFMSTVNI